MKAFLVVLLLFSIHINAQGLSQSTPPTASTTPTSTAPTSTLTTPSSSATPSSTTDSHTSSTSSTSTTAPSTSASVVTPTTTSSPPSNTPVVTSIDGTLVTTVVTVVGPSSSTSSSQSAPSPTSSPSSDSSGGLGTGSIIGLSVAGGVAVICLIAFFIWKLTRKRFSDFDDGEAIKWPDLNTHGGPASDSHPLPVHNTGRAGFDTGSETSLSRVNSNNHSTTDFNSNPSSDPYAVPPLPHLNPNQPYRDDPVATGYYDPYRGPIPGTIEQGAGQEWSGESYPMTQMNSGRMSPGPNTAYSGDGRRSPGSQAVYGRTVSPAPQAAYGRMSPGPQAAYGASTTPVPPPPGYDTYGAR